MSENSAPNPVNIYLTWSLGIDIPGFALVYAQTPEEAFALLDNYTEKAQPRHRLFTAGVNHSLLHYLPQSLSSRAKDASRYGHHLYQIGISTDPPVQRVVVVDHGEDVSYDD
ncbi:hypothetical protein FDY95_22565 [Hymenobacter jeollabukensis]|uniref:Uncharacterized protein n=2 Tax=Hymenobacter jeollabukensis TaxID=2025313 RepID=A0A5R8WJA3_9BACT|nr:hypothetical protein FDY95_22565 [Hymenobacter jeollabukensis]